MTDEPLLVENGEAIAVADVPLLGADAFRAFLLSGIAGGSRVAALFAHPRETATPSKAATEIWVVLAEAETASLAFARRSVEGGSFPSLTPACPQVHLFEREIAEETGLVPEGHPWLKPVRFPGTGGAAGPVGVMDFYTIEGEAGHEVAVGPVHAGVIEPGHFRFQCHGEVVQHLEISLGYQHRGIERNLVEGAPTRIMHYVETLAGDSSIGHATAHCHALEGLARVHAPAKAQFLRAIALELERLANHVGDLGALAGDVGYLPTASFCGRLRGDYLNMTALICGNRFGRGLVRPGGVVFDVDEAMCAELLARLTVAERETREAIGLLWDSHTVMSRFTDTGKVNAETARIIGLVGPAARASGLSADVRTDFPKGAYRYSHVPVSTWETGDVFARAYVRWLEIQQSLRFLRDELRELPGGAVVGQPGPLLPDHIVASLVEGWRGEICHVLRTDGAGRVVRHKVVDPSFHNWFGLALALRGEQISDFPLCNKSFNLSYAGFDL